MSTQTVQRGSPEPNPARGARGGRVVEYQHYIDEQLGKTRRRVKWVDLWTGLALLAAGVTAYLLLAAVVDHWIVPGGLGTLGRWLLLVGLVGGVAFHFVGFIVPFFLRKVNPVYAAAALEQGGPMKNTLINFLLLRKQPTAMPEGVLDAMKEQAAVRLAGVPSDAPVDRSALLRWCYVLAAVLVGALGYALVAPKDSFRSIQRVLSPWAELAAPTRVRIESVDPGDAQRRRDEVVTVSLRAAGLRSGDAVTLFYSATGNPADEVPLPMQTDASRYLWKTVLPPGSEGLKQDLFYYIQAGDATTPRYRLKVLATPVIAVRAVRFDYPAYTGLPPRTVERQGDLKALEGTRVTLTAEANQPIRAAHVAFDKARNKDVELQADGLNAVGGFELALQKDRTTPVHTSYVLRFVNLDGEENPKPAEHKIEVTADQPPEVRVVEPNTPADKELTLPLGGLLRVTAAARDPDFQLGELTVVLRKTGSLLREERLLSEPRYGEFSNTLVLDASRYNLRVGEWFTFRIRAADNKTPNPNVVETKDYTVVVTPPGPGQPPQQDPRQNPQANPDAQNQPQNGANQPNDPAQQNGANQPNGANRPQNGNQPNAAPNRNPGGQPEQRQPGDPPQNGNQQGGNPQPGDRPQPGDNPQAGSGNAPQPPGNEQPRIGNQPQNGNQPQPGNQPGGEQRPGEQRRPDEQNQPGNPPQNEPNSDAGKQGDGNRSNASEKPIDPNVDPGRAFEELQKHFDQQDSKNNPNESKQPQPSPQDQGPQPNDGNQQPNGGNQSGDGNQQPNANPQQGNSPAGDPPQSGGASQKNEPPNAGGQPNGENSPASGGSSGSGSQPQKTPDGGQPGNQQKSGGSEGTGRSQSNAPPGNEAGSGAGPQNQPAQKTGDPNAKPGGEGGATTTDPKAGGTERRPGENNGTGREQKQPAGGANDTAAPQNGSQPHAGGDASQKPDGAAQPGEKPVGEKPQPGGEQRPGATPNPGQPNVGREGNPDGSGTGTQAGGDPSKPEAGPRPGEKPNGPPSVNEQNPSGNQKNVGGRESPASDGQGSPNPQERAKPRNDASGQQAGNQAESPNQDGGQASHSKTESNTQGGEAGDRSAKNGEKGGGQRSPQSGTGAGGQSQAGEQGSGTSSQPGGEAASNQAGDQVRSGDPSQGKPGGEPGAGTATPNAGNQPGGATGRQSGQSTSGEPNGPPQNSQQPAAGNEAGGSQRGQPDSQPGMPPDAENSANPNAGGNAPDGNAPRPPRNPATTAGPADPANLDYAKQVTELTLERLKQQLDKGEVDPELLKRFTSRESLEEFARRWDAMRQNAKEPGADGEAARKQLQDNLKSLGLQPRTVTQQGSGAAGDDSRDQRGGKRSEPPAKYLDQYRAYTTGVGRAEK